MKTVFPVLALAISSMSLVGATLVTTKPSAISSITAAGASGGPTVSADGRFITYLSHAPNLASNVTDQRWMNIYRYDRVLTNLSLVTVAFDGTPADGNSDAPQMSTNGQVILFRSIASNLVPNDTNSLPDIFIRDLTAGTTTLVSIDTNGVPALRSTNRFIGSLPEQRPMLSADGRFVVFQSSAIGLADGESSLLASAVYRRDMVTQTTTLISPLPAYATTNAFTSTLLAATPDTSRVLFVQSEGSPGTNSIVQVRDLNSGAVFTLDNTRYISESRISDDGRFVAGSIYQANAKSLVRWRIDTGEILVVRSNAVPGTIFVNISSEGRFICHGDDTNVYRWDGDSQSEHLVNVTTSGGTPVSGNSHLRSVSRDGSLVCFVSDSPDIVPGTSGGVFQLYLHDMSNAVTRLISTTSSGPSQQSHLGATADVARDGSLIVFDTPASDLIAGDANGFSDVFIQDLATAETALISRCAPATQSPVTPTGHSFLFAGSLSSNGQYLAFTGYDSNLTPNDTNLLIDAFLADLNSGTITRIAGTGSVRSAIISGNGQCIVLVRKLGASQEEIVRYDRTSGVLDRIGLMFSDALGSRLTAVNAGGTIIAYRSSQITIFNTETKEQISLPTSGGPIIPTFSEDGQFLVFGGNAVTVWNATTKSQYSLGDWNTRIGMGGSYLIYRLNDGYVYRRDLLSGNTQTLFQTPRTEDSVYSPGYSSSRDGKQILSLHSTNYWSDILHFDVTTGSLSVLDGTTHEPRSLPFPQITPDGRFVVYGSKYSTLFRSRTQPGRTALIVRDLLLGTSTLLAVTPEGASPNDNVFMPIVSGDGRTVAFQSLADDIVPGDFNSRRDIFIVKLGAPDSDEDGIDDDWEIAYFSNLTRNGTGDADSDGVSDRDEFVAGTDPTNTNSLFRVMTIAPVGGSSKRIVWSGNPGRSYRVEYKDDLRTAGWSTLDSSITWTGSTASATDDAPAPARFYRVQRLP